MSPLFRHSPHPRPRRSPTAAKAAAIAMCTLAAAVPALVCRAQAGREPDPAQKTDAAAASNTRRPRANRCLRPSRTRPVESRRFFTPQKYHGDRTSKRFHGWLDTLRRENPEKFQQLMRLRRENPKEFQRQISQIIRKRQRGRMSPKELKCFELSRKYLKAKDPKTKAKIMKQLRAAVEAAFDARIADRLRRLERMEKELQRIRAQIEERKANRSKICQARIEELTRDPKYRWNW